MPPTKKQHISDKVITAEKGNAFAMAVLQSLPVGVIIFDKELKIVSANTVAGELIDVQATVDVTLAKGTSEKIRGNWHKILLGTIESGKASYFNNVSYRAMDKSAVLQITCTPFIDKWFCTFQSQKRIDL